jgi:ubiquinone/menaquinone biosynthesis C-methylase UbiE
LPQDRKKQNKKMETDIDKWLNEDGIILLRKIGIKEDQIVLDFGCGSGNYTIPAAKIVGDKGKVYAVDEDGYKLKQLASRINSTGLQNIEIIKTSGELDFGYEGVNFDAVLFYDIFWYFSLKSSKLSKLLKEVYRVLESGALVSIYPEHIETEKLRQKIEESGFTLKRRFSEQVLHDGSFKVGQILNFRK